MYITAIPLLYKMAVCGKSYTFKYNIQTTPMQAHGLKVLKAQRFALALQNWITGQDKLQSRLGRLPLANGTNSMDNFLKRFVAVFGFVCSVNPKRCYLEQTTSLLRGMGTRLATMASCLFQNCRSKNCVVRGSRIDSIVTRIDSIVIRIDSVVLRSIDSICATFDSIVSTIDSIVCQVPLNIY